LPIEPCVPGMSKKEINELVEKEVRIKLNVDGRVCYMLNKQCLDFQRQIKHVNFELSRELTL
jgi:collagenase-like PrtC family protease